MTDRDRGEQNFGWTLEETRRRQATLGLELTHAQRLQWLERTVEELQPWVGLAARTETTARVVAAPGTAPRLDPRGPGAG